MKERDDSRRAMVIGGDTVYVGTEHEHLKDRRVRILHILRGSEHGGPWLLTQDEEFGGAAGIRASDRVDIFPIDANGRLSFRGWDVPAADVERFRHLGEKRAAKSCTKCGAVIDADDVVLTADTEELCHDCADSCDAPDCPKCRAQEAR